MLYTCSRCKKYKTSLKSNLKRHMNRKKSCPLFIRKVPHNNTQIPHNNTTINHFICQHCNKSFSRKDSLNRHILLYCKEYKLNQENVRLQEENHMLKSQITTINTNVTNNNITNTINNNNIIIKAYGNEELEHILPRLPMLIKNFPTTAVTDMICETYYDPEYPENKTVKINTTKEKWAHIYNGKKWDVHKKMDVIMNVLQKSFKFIDTFFEKHEIQPPEYMQNKVTWEEVRNMWYDDTYPDQEMKDTAEKILINQNQTSSTFREFITYKKSNKDDD